MARVKYHRYGRNGVRVSTQWLTVLRAADRAGVGFTVNSGHRTMREQARLFRQNMRWNGFRWVQRRNADGTLRPLTAFPSPTAPHIRIGNPAHALDVSTLDGGERRLEAWLDRPGIDAENTVPGEAWHLELSRAELRRLWRRYR